MTRWISFAAAAAIVTFGVARADAQITTVIAPPKPPATRQAEVARREAATQDSVARVALTDMKKWVDSAAAALALRPDTAGVPADTGVAAPQPPAAPADSARARDTRPVEPTAPEFREGRRAPDTATTIPTLAVVGGCLVIVGLGLRRRVSRSAVRVRR